MISGIRIPRTTIGHISLQLQSNENVKISLFQNIPVFFGTQKRFANDQENQKSLKLDIVDPGRGRVGATKALIRFPKGALALLNETHVCKICC